MYDPYELEEEYERFEHGKARMNGISNAIQEADREKDTVYGIYFRLQLCEESMFYGDSLQILTVFPQVLALADQYPDIEVNYRNTIGGTLGNDLMYRYEWLLCATVDYYQISFEDCKRFQEDYLRRNLSYGYNLRSYYDIMYDFYRPIDMELAREYFHKFEKEPRDYHSGCEACERNLEIEFYLREGNEKKAAKLAKDIASFQLVCDVKDSAWLRMNVCYLRYYLDLKEFEKAEKYCRLVESRQNGETAWDRFDYYVYCYAHTNPGKALRIYKKRWKKELEWKCPLDVFEMTKYISGFFYEIGKNKEMTVLKMDFDKSFPLYRKNQTYAIEELYRYYYQRAKGLADKFDARNGTDFFNRELDRVLETELETKEKIQ